MSAEAAFRRRDVNASDAIAELLHPNMGYREQQKRKGIEPKDFERANRLLLKKQQAAQRERKLAEAAKVREAFKLKKFKSVQPRVFEQLTREEPATTEPPKRHDFLRRGVSTSALQKKKQQEEAKTKAGRPSTAPDSARATAGGSIAPEKPKRQHTKPPVPTREELEELSNQLAKLHHREKPDFVNANAWEVIKQAPNRPRDDADGNGAVHESFGRIPEYLLQRKEQWAREEEERRRNAPDPDCPPGMVRLPEDERVSTLAVLKQSLEEAQQQVSRLPLRIETASQIRRKNDLEQRLREIEDAIKVFSKPKVYVAKPETEPSLVRRRQANAVAA